MATRVAQQTSINIPNPIADFDRIRSKTGMGVYASNNNLFKDAVIGRDSIEVASDVLSIFPDVAKEVILTLAKLQGTKYNKHTEEEPGRIHHEYRSLFIDGSRIAPSSEAILRDLQKKWGYPEEDFLLYYGCIDATPQYVCLVADYCRVHGAAILAETVVNKDGHVVTIEQSILASLQWLSTRINNSEISLLEYHRTNSRGIENQVWKDSLEAYVHANGEIANHAAPIAPIEVQGYTYDAFTRGHQLLHRQHPGPAHQWKVLADTVQAQTFKLFWMPSKHYFAQALDRHPVTGVTRQITISSSNPALLLGTSIFDNLAKSLSQKYVEVLVRGIYSHQFLTPVGIRSRSLRFANVVGHHDYHGAWTVWPKETFNISRGLRRQGFARLANQLETCLVNGSIITQGYPEFFYCGPDNRVYFGPPQTHLHIDNFTLIRGTNIPEQTQAWTLSALAVIAKSHRRPTRHDSENGWQARLDHKLFLSNPKLEVVKTLQAQNRLYPHYPYRLDSTAAWKFKYSYNHKALAAVRRARSVVRYKLRLAH